MIFVPDKVIIEKKAIDYKIGENILNNIKENKIKYEIVNSLSKIADLRDLTPQELYAKGKKFLLVGVKRSLKFETCKPSAHYQLPLVSGCSGKCEYCYLNTRLSAKPYTKVFVNLEDILDSVNKYILDRNDLTVFEAAATSDPIPTERYTAIIKNTIEYFSDSELGRLRLVTKFTDIDSLIGAKHNEHTAIRFSINTDNIINRFEHSTPSLIERISAASKLSAAGFPMGFIIAPVFIDEDYKNRYGEMLNLLKDNFSQNTHPITFEIISHRFTAKAKESILSVFPKTDLPMNDAERKFKYGQFGYGKFVYENDVLKDMKYFFEENISKIFSNYKILYSI